MKAHKIGGIILTALLFVATIITIVPFIWMFISSFAPNSEIVKVTGGLFPRPSTIDNYVSIQAKFNFMRLFANSLVVAVLKTAIAIYTSAVLGYVIAVAIALVLASKGQQGGANIVLSAPMWAGLFVLTVVMCLTAATVSIRKVMKLDPAMVFKG